MSRTYSKSFVKNPNMAENGHKTKTSSFIGIIPNSSNNAKGEKANGAEFSNGHHTHTLSSNFGSSNHHSRPSIKEKQTLSKSPVPSKSKSKGKNIAQPNKQVKEQNPKKIFLLTTKTKSKSKEQEAFLAMGIRKSPFAESKTPKASSENQGNYKIQFKRGKVADHMTPDRCSRSDLTLEECRSTFSVMETQDTLENEFLFDAHKKIQRDRSSLKPFQTTPNELVEEEAHRRHTISRDVVRPSEYDIIARRTSYENLTKQKNKQIIQNGFCCTKHPTKKAKYMQAKPALETGIFQYFCSECAVDAVQKNIPVQRLEIPTPQIKIQDTMETQPSVSSDEGPQKVWNNREDEIKNFLKRIEDISQKIPSYEKQCLTSKEQLKGHLNAIIARIHTFTAKMIDALHEQAEIFTHNFKNEFEDETLRLNNSCDALQIMFQGLLEIERDIKNNYENILHNIEEQPYTNIMKTYNQKLESFDQLVNGIKSLSSNSTKYLPTERFSSFKRKLKTLSNDLFAEAYDQNAPETCVVKNSPPSSPPTYGTKTIGDFEDFLKTEESEDETFKINSSRNHKNINISFKDKNVFQNALQSSIETAPNGPSHALQYQTEASSSPIFVDPQQTANSHFPLDENLIEEASPFSEDTFIEYGQNNEIPSGASSLNKYVHLLDKVSQKRDTRNNYLKKGSLYELGRKASLLYDHASFINFIENKLKDESIRETCQKSLFQSPTFEDPTSRSIIY